jgi:hypothetical protein
MSKSLTGTNIFAEKEATTYKPTFLIELQRDHPESGTSTLYYCSWSNEYVLNSITYKDQIVSLGELRQTIAPGGGLAAVSDWFLTLRNPESPTELLSDMLQSYFLENDVIKLQLVFQTGTEVAADILTLFDGVIQDAPNNTRDFELFCKDGTMAKLKDVPQEVADFVRFPYMPLDNVNKTIPVVFGSLNVPPWSATLGRPQMAQLINTDKFDHQYAPMLIGYTAGQPHVWYRSARLYATVESYTQATTFVTIDSSSRVTKLRPIRSLGTNDVATWKNTTGFDSSEVAACVNGSDLDLQFRGSPKLGTLTAINVSVNVAAGAAGTISWTIQKAGETDITSSGAAADLTIDISAWDFSNDWDFEQIKVLLGFTDVVNVESVSLDVTFDEQETGDQLGGAVFMPVAGYKDVAAQYQDGSTITGVADALLEHPLDILIALLRDRRTGMALLEADIDTTNYTAEKAKTSTWKFAFQVTTAMGFKELSEFCVQAKIRMYRNFDGTWKFSIFDKTNDPSYGFWRDVNIAVKNLNSKESTLKVYQSPMSEIVNEWQVSYGWDAALAEFTAVEIASPHYLLTGTGVLDSTAGTLTDASATFVTDGVQAGYKAIVERDVSYDVDSVDSETVLSVSVSDPADSPGDRADTYYIGANTTWECVRSVQKYKTTNTKTLQSRYIQDEATAQALLAHLVEYWTGRRTMVRFRSWLNVCDLELGDFIFIDDDDVPPNKRPVQIGTLSAQLISGTGNLSMTMSGTGGSLINENDILFIKPANGDFTRETVRVASVNESTEVVTLTARNIYGTPMHTWAAGAQVWRAVTKFEVVGIKLLPGKYEYEVTARETPRDYTPVGHAAPAGTASYDSASATDRALYGWATYPNGEASWLVEESAVSYAKS